MLGHVAMMLVLEARSIPKEEDIPGNQHNR